MNPNALAEALYALSAHVAWYGDTAAQEHVFDTAADLWDRSPHAPFVECDCTPPDSAIIAKGAKGQPDEYDPYWHCAAEAARKPPAPKK